MAMLEETPSGLSSQSSSGLRERVGLRLCFGGEWQQQKDGSVKYVGGETYLEKVPSSMRYADLMHRMSEKVNGAVTLKYSPPGEEVDVNNLVTCVDDDHVQEMFEEYFKAAKASDTPGKTFRLKIWLFEAKEEELTPEDIGKAKRGQRLGTPKAGETFQHLRSSSSGSNNSSASAGTRSPHFQGRKLGYPASNTLSRPLNDVEMQEKEAEEMAEEMNADDEEEIAYNERNWHAYATNNLHRAIDKTFDSCGWPHDRSPFLKARQRNADTPGRDSGIGGLSHRSGKALSSVFAATDPSRVRTGGTGGLGFVSDPMDFGTPDTGSVAPRMYTQDSYKEDLESEAEPVPRLPSPAALLSSSHRQAATHRSIHLPSQLGSDVGNAFTTDTQAEEKAHMEVIVNGVADRVLREGPEQGNGHHRIQQEQTHGPVDLAWPASPYSLPRTPSGFAITYDSVFRIPQDEVRVLQVIGEGTFGEVVLAYNSVFGRVAVKWLKPAKMDKHRLKFWEEARMLAALNHPNVLRFYGVVTKEEQDQTVVGIMTEFMPGSSLSNYLRSGMGSLSLLQRAELARGAVNGLAYLHQMNIVHFDLKPDNLLLDNMLLPNYPSPGVKVADFGLSKQKFHKYVSGVRDLRGTLPYMAPELVHDPDHVSESADIWSLGIVFWEMLTLETPFQYLSPQSIMTGHMMGKLRPETPAYCEAEWRELLNGCLQQNPSDRWTLHQIAQWLDQILEAQYSLNHASSMYST